MFFCFSTLLYKHCVYSERPDKSEIASRKSREKYYTTTLIFLLSASFKYVHHWICTIGAELGRRDDVWGIDWEPYNSSRTLAVCAPV